MLFGATGALTAGIVIALVDHSASALSVCGGADKLPCTSGYRCEQPIGSCLEDYAAFGKCVPIVSSCPTGDSPMCGCDGRTYSSHCAAQQANVSVAVTGSCTANLFNQSPHQSPTDASSCFADHECPVRSYCRMDYAGCQASAAAPGVCRVQPLECPASTDSVLVCGCNGRIYDSACAAAAQGVSVTSYDHCVSALGVPLP